MCSAGLLYTPYVSGKKSLNLEILHQTRENILFPFVKRIIEKFCDKFQERNENKEECCSSYTDATSPVIFLNKRQVNSQ